VTYAAPEQREKGALGPWTDLYALGLTLHEALTGIPVFGGEEGGDEPSLRLPKILPPSRYRNDVPRALDELVMSLLAQDPKDRPKSGAEVREALLALGGAAAPFPSGPTTLTFAIERALEQVAQRKAAHPSADRTVPLTKPQRVTRKLG
jgi:serine/threonine-protein kinase